MARRHRDTTGRRDFPFDDDAQHATQRLRGAPEQLIADGEERDVPRAEAQLLDATDRDVEGAARVDAVELRPDHVAFLKAQGLAETIWEGDFLEVEPQRVYDGVIMNPPFARGDDMRHVLHALKFVRPGGRLAAVVSQCFTFHKGKIVDAFLAAIEEHQGQVVKLPPGTFAHVGTQMETAIVVFDVAA